MSLKEPKNSQEVRDYLAQRQRKYRAGKKIRDTKKIETEA